MKNKEFDVVIIGAGVSGVFCALNLNDALNVLLVDANEELLKKFKVSGNGNANMTNLSDVDTLLDNVIYGTKKFMYYGFKNYGPDKIIDFLKKHKMKFYQRQNTTRIYLTDSNPQNINKFKGMLSQKQSLEILLNTTIKKTKKVNDYFELTTQNNQTIRTKNVVVATGGKSFSKFAKTNGYGYELAKSFNHNISPIFPMGVAIDLKKQLIQFQNCLGTSINNVEFKLFVDNKLVAAESGDLMVTHAGIGGPVVRRISSYLAYHQHNNYKLFLNILNKEELIDTLNKISKLFELFNHFNHLTKKVINNFYSKLNFNPQDDVKNFSKTKKESIINYFCELSIENIKFPLNLEGAISTGGGVDTKQLDPKTFESKLISNLYFIGEVNNTNALTGGFNITVCYASAMCCSTHINQKYCEGDNDDKKY